MANKGMEKIEIYRFQLEDIDNALRLTSNIHKSELGRTCHDRCVRTAKRYTENALNGNIDQRVNYATGKNK